MNFDTNTTNRLVFWAQWFQTEANMFRSFYLTYFPADNTLEIYDQTTRKTFMRRTKVVGLNETAFFIGAKINIFGRQIEILDYGDTMTKNKLVKSRERTFCLIKPAAVLKMDQIISRIYAENFLIIKLIMIKINNDIATKYYNHKSADSTLPFLIEHLTSGEIVVMELVAKNAVNKLIQLTGPDDPIIAKEQAPNSLRAKYGINLTKNAVECSESYEFAAENLEMFFPHHEQPRLPFTLKMKGSTLGVIKPHAIKDGKLGRILSIILESGQFKISAMRMISVERKNCEEFFEVYKGVVPEYVGMVTELSNGPCLAFELYSNNPNFNVHKEFRVLCGPIDPELAKQLRPKTIRAQFGISKVQNAIHCTDLEDDIQSDVEYFFKILE